MKRVFGGVSALAWVAVATSVSAQSVAGTTDPATQPAGADAQNSSSLSEVVVTANRRTERLIDVPISVAVTSGQTLDKLNLHSATDLTKVTPGLSFGASNTARGDGFQIRGVGTNVFADGVEQSVGTVVDGVPLERAGQGLTDLIDVDRIEVLRGPQGLLFGRNASAGLISITTRRPTQDFSMDASASYASYGQYNVDGSIAGPILPDRILGRLTAYANGSDGLVSNITTGQKYNANDEFGVRGQLFFTLSPSVDLTLRADYSKRDDSCCIWTIRQFASPATAPTPGTLFLGSFTGAIGEGPRADTVNADGDIFGHQENWGTSAELNWAIGGGYKLTSITAYRGWTEADNNDADVSPLDVLNRNYGADNLHQVSQELRITSPAAQPIEFVAGLFFFNSTNKGDFQQVGRFALSLAAAQAGGVDIPLAPGLTLPASALFGRDIVSDIGVTDYAAFGQATWHITPKLGLVLGGRLTNTRVTLDYARTGTPGSSAYNFILGSAFAPLAFSAATSDTNFSWKTGLKYDLSDKSNVYATVSRGYKGPGYNSLLDIVVPSGLTAQEFTRVNPEIPTSYEAGYKAELFERRVSANISIFRTDFKDFQAQVIYQPAGSPLASYAIANAGELRTQGFEAEVNVRPARDLTLGAAVAFNDSTFQSFKAAPCPAAAAVITTVGAACGPTVAGGANAASFDASGLRSAGAPRWTANLTALYEFDLPLPQARGYAQALYSWRDDTTYALYPSDLPNPTTQKAYGLLNGSVGATFHDHYTVSVFVKNLLDQHFVSNIFATPFDAVGGLAQFPTRDSYRTIGVQLAAKF